MMNITKGDYYRGVGIGVKPHVELKKEEAYEYAYKEALEHVKNKYAATAGYKFLIDEVEQVLAGYKE